MSEQWFHETLHDGYAQSMRIDHILFEEKSDHQHIIIFETPIFGRVLVLDGVVQTTEKDEFIYHEMFAHIPLLSHSNPKKVLIVGGGDGGLLREVLKHACVDSVVMVEIDAQVVEMCKTHLPQHSQGAFSDERLELVIGDGLAFVRQTNQQFDVILSDSTDPIGPGEVLFSDDFYSHCQRCLAEGGVLVTQNGVSFLQLNEIMQTRQRLSSIYPYCGFYSAAVPTYVGGNMHYAWASQGLDLATVDFDVSRASEIDARYYQPTIHKAAFELPRYVTAGELK